LGRYLGAGSKRNEGLNWALTGGPTVATSHRKTQWVTRRAYSILKPNTDAGQPQQNFIDGRPACQGGSSLANIATSCPAAGTIAVSAKRFSPRPAGCTASAIAPLERLGRHLLEQVGWQLPPAGEVYPNHQNQVLVRRASWHLPSPWS